MGLKPPNLGREHYRTVAARMDTLGRPTIVHSGGTYRNDGRGEPHEFRRLPHRDRPKVPGVRRKRKRVNSRKRRRERERLRRQEESDAAS